MALTAALTAVFFVLGLSIHHSFGEAWERGTQRAAVPSENMEGNPDGSTPTDAEALIASTATLVDGSQVATEWIQPLATHDASAAPPGLRTLPKPGEAVLSPALIQAGYQAEDFGWKTSNAGAGPHGAIAETALLTPSERLMWVRPSEDAPLSVEAAAYYVQGFGAIGDEPAFVTDPEVLDSGQTAAGILYFLLLPSLILLTSGVRARSDVRIQRMQFMAKIGIADRKIRPVLGLETGVLALIGASAGTLLYTVFSPLLGKIPGTRLELAPGSLIPTWWMGPCAVLVVTVVATLLGGMGRLRPRRGRLHRSKPRGIPAVLLVCALGVAAAAGNGFDPLGSVLSSAQGLGTVTFLIASFVAVALTPLSVPYFTYLLSSRLSATDHPPLWAAAKRIASDPIRCSRLSAALAGLIVIVGVAGSAWTASGAPNVEGPEQQTAPHAVSVSWVDPQQDAFSRFEQKLHAATGEPFALEIVEISDAEGEPTANKVRAPECEAAAAFFKASANRLCGDDNAAALNSLVLTHSGYEVASPDEVAADTGGPVRDAIVVSQAGRDVEEIQRVLGRVSRPSALSTPKQTSRPFCLSNFGWPQVLVWPSFRSPGRLPARSVMKAKRMLNGTLTICAWGFRCGR